VVDREGQLTQAPVVGANREVQRRRRALARYPRTDHARTVGSSISPVWEAPPDRGMLQAGGVSRRDARLRRLIALSDVLMTYVSLILVLVTITPGSIMLTPAVVVMVPVVLIAAKALGLYDRDQHLVRKTTLDEVPSLVYLSLICALTVWLAEGVMLTGWLSRPEVLALIATSFGLLAVGRVVARAVATRVLPTERCIVVGTAGDAARIARKVEQAPGVNAVVTARVALDDDDRLGTKCGIPARGSLTAAGSLASAISADRADRVIVAPDGHDQDEILHAIRLIKAYGLKVTVLPRLLEVVGSSSIFEDVDGLTMLGLRSYGVSASSALLKRAVDVIGAAAVLIGLAPLMGMIAIAVKLSSPGPVFFKQRRIGRRGQIFNILKFRTMVKDAEAIKGQLRHRNEAEGGLFKIADDPRITTIGRILRKTSLDELPQLLNVLSGSMSLVGPRPLVQDEDALIEGWQRRRLAVKPGMTGLWQIFGSSRIPMDEMVKIDYLYGANWSLWLDLKILLRTVPYVLQRRGF
jgi:exopolysaccharide biosynthesis polyprenyl glycosylphosphotransferase